MKAVVSVIVGLLGLVMLLGVYMDVVLLITSKQFNSNPTILTIGPSVRITGLLLGIIATTSGYLYLKSKQQKLKIISYVGIFWGIFTIALSLLPLSALFYFFKAS